jgi:transcription initiation factor TFIIIB Brf1 subunit/transcription initiation factor TFIIB
MTDFQLFDQALENYEKDKSSDINSEIHRQDKCSHSDTHIDNGVVHCIICGEQIDRNISNDKQWSYHDTHNPLYTMDPTRCQMRKSEDRNIFKDVETLGFSDKIVELANNIYSDVTRIEKKQPADPELYKICRGNSRKALVFACIFHAYKLSGDPQSCESLIKTFNIDRKAGLKGLKQVNLNAPKKSPIRTTYITPGNLVDEIMDKFSATDEQKKEVMELYNSIENRSSSLNRSRPQSVASGIVYYWICTTNKPISIKDFTERVKLSELTVNKKAKEIARVLGTELGRGK